MIIRELNATHFGKFEEQRLEFLPGLNIIEGGNETGKSTLHALIRGMLYGIERKGNRGGRPDEYTLRQPWTNPEWFEGSMRVSYGGNMYRIERRFVRENRLVRLIREDDGKELEPDQIPELAEGLTEAGFTGTVWISQEDSVNTQSMSDRLKELVAGYREDGEHEPDTARALERLQKQRRKLEEERRQALSEAEEKAEAGRLELRLLRESAGSGGVLFRPAGGEEDAVSGEERYPEDDAFGEEGYPEEDAAPGEGEDPEDEAGMEEGPPAARPAAWPRGFSLLLAALLLCSGGLGIACAVVLESPLIRLLMGIAGILFCAGAFLTARFSFLRPRPVPEEGGRPAARGARAADAAGEEDDPAARQDRGTRKNRETGQERETRQQLEQETAAQRESAIRKAGENLRVLEEEADRLREDDDLLASYRLAEERIRELAGAAHQEVSERIAARASNILREVTGGRYTGLSLDEKMQVSLSMPRQLVRLEQTGASVKSLAWFCLRMAAGEYLGGPDLPVILDDAFVLLDDARLRSVLEWLDAGGRQVILFTGQTREKTILEELRGGA